MEPLEWLLEFVDKITGPAKTMAQSVKALVGNLRDLEKVFERLNAKGRTLESTLRRLGGTAQAVGRIVRMMDGAGGLGARMGAGGRDPTADRRKYELWWTGQLEKQDRAAARAAEREATRAARLTAQKERAAAKDAARATKAAERQAAVEARAAAKEATKAAKDQARIQGAAPSKTTVTWKQAQKIFKGDAGENLETFKDRLKQMGVSSMDSSLLVRKLRMELEGSRKEAMKLGAGGWLASFRRNIWTLSHTLNVFKSVASGLYDTLKDVFEVGKGAVGAFLKTAMFRENTLTSFKEMLRPFHGEAAGGEALKLFQRAQRFAVETPMETEDVVKGYQSFLGGGVDPLHVEKMFASSADAFAKFGKEAYESFVHGMIKMQSTGTTTKDALSEMAQGAHLDLTKVYAHLGKMAGFKGDEDQVREQVLKKLGKGEFHSSAGQWAAMMAMSGSEDFGGFAKKQSQTLTGTVSTLKSALTDLLQSVDLGEWAGMKELKASVLWLTDQIKPGTAYGERLLKAIQRVIDALFGGLRGIRESGIEGLIKMVEKASEVIASALDQAWAALAKINSEGMGNFESMLSGAGELIGKALGTALAAMLPILVEETVKAIPGIVSGAAKGAWNIGANAGRATYQAIQNNGTAKTAYNTFMAPMTAASAVTDYLFGSPTESDALKRRSGRPIGTMSRAPATSDAGMSMPSYDSGGVVPGPVGRPILAWVRGGERFEGLGSSSQRGGGAGGASGPLVQVMNNINIEGSAAGDPDSIEEAVETASMRGALRALERIGMSRGLTDAPA